jgi:hypothetical protein
MCYAIKGDTWVFKIYFRILLNMYFKTLYSPLYFYNSKQCTVTNFSFTDTMHVLELEIVRNSEDCRITTHRNMYIEVMTCTKYLFL